MYKAREKLQIKLIAFKKSLIIKFKLKLTSKDQRIVNSNALDKFYSWIYIIQGENEKTFSENLLETFIYFCVS